MKLSIKKYNQEGDIAHEYHALRNIQNSDGKIEDFRTSEINIDLQHPINIECQDSYDGTVNLIINDDINPPRIINSRFTTLENNRYKIINRNQLIQTNLYQQNKIDSQTRLFRNINSIPVIDLTNISNYGKLACGNYTFYVKFADNDYNQTDVVAESGIVSIFKGDVSDVASITGGLVDEKSDKAVTLRLSNVDTSFSQLYLYYVRETSDINGFRITKAAKLVRPYPIKSGFVTITITGYEDIEEINYDDLNIQYNLVTAVKTQTQVQNMLFFGNIQDINVNIKDLQNLSLYINVSMEQNDSIGWINETYKTNGAPNQTEYYDPLNVYYKLGYWPGELYRLGIVYILNDDSLSPVFNLRGCSFASKDDKNILDDDPYKDPFLNEDDYEMDYIPTNEFLSHRFLSNTKGVFKVADDWKIINYGETPEVKPLCFKIEISERIQACLKEKYGVKGYFIVRQKRIPITVAQGLSIGVDKSSHLPTLKTNSKFLADVGTSENYICESFISDQGTLTTDYESRRIVTGTKQSSGLLCLDACVNPLLQSNFDGSQFIFNPVITGKLKQIEDKPRLYYFDETEEINYNLKEKTKSSAVFVDTDVPLVCIDDYGFSTRAGSAEEAKQFAFFGGRNYNKENTNLVRGVFAPFIGLTESLEDNVIYNIQSQDYAVAVEQEYFAIRGNDNSPYFAISNRYEMSNNKTEMKVYRGDCYTCTITFRMQRNFVDPSVPTNDLIVDPDTWSKVYNGYNATDIEKWSEINIADLNTVPIGTWVTFKVLSNYNLGLRALDRSNVEETALLGNPRSFYPYSDISTNASYKMNESWILNDGYNATVGIKRNFLHSNVPYLKDIYDTRVMFSNVQVNDDFKNAYRIFQGLSYKDIDRQYGAIVKLLDWGTNLFCAFEHGLAILPINEKALIQSQTGQSIHMYGAGVLQNQVSLISSDFGSIWQDSIVRTPVGIYGVDTYNKKIWRYSNSKGLEILSDTKIQSYLNEYIKLSEKDKYPQIALKNVKTHYNNHKGDVMFTFYNNDKDIVWNICYNERLDKWITRYSWTPLISDNIDTTFVSFDKKRAELLSYIYENQFSKFGLNLTSNIWENSPITINTVGFDSIFTFDFELPTVIYTSWLDENENEHFEKIENHFDKENNKYYITQIDSSLKSTRIDISDSLKTYLGETNELLYIKFDINYTPKVSTLSSNKMTQTVVLVRDYESLSENNQNKYKKLLSNGIYVHGRSGIFDEINYNDNDPENQIKPTNWYDKQEPFEFEFVVNNLIGAHKIFDNLVIISNNVQPKELEFEIIGDVYDFNKMGIYKSDKFSENEFIRTDKSQEFKNVKVVYDNVTNKYGLLINQECKNIKEYGRMKGNIHYKEDAWYITIEPIQYKKKHKINNQINVSNDYSSTRIRDKFLKIRVKYSGEDLAIISSLKTLMTLSYA